MTNKALLRSHNFKKADTSRVKCIDRTAYDYDILTSCITYNRYVFIAKPTEPTDTPTYTCSRRNTTSDKNWFKEKFFTKMLDRRLPGSRKRTTDNGILKKVEDLNVWTRYTCTNNRINEQIYYTNRQIF